MSLLDFDGAEDYVTAGIGDHWTIQTGAVSVGATSGRRGGPGIVVAPAAGQTGVIDKTITASGVVFAGGAFKVSSIATGGILLAFLDGGSLQCELRVQASSGLLQVTRNGTLLATATDNALLPNQFYFIEFKVTIHNSTGATVVKVNGAAVGGLTLTNQDTQNTANATANVVRVTGMNNVHTVTFDDFYVGNDTGSVVNDLLGDVRVDAIFPTGAGNYTQWDPSAGSNWAAVDDNPANDDTDYVETSVVNEIDSYAMADLSGADPIAVKSTIRSRLTDAGPGQVAPFFRRASVDAVGANQSPGSTYLSRFQVHETDPTDTSTWTLAKLNAMEFGIKRTS